MIIIDGFPFDTSTKESHERKSTTTKFPLERGVDFTDHVIQSNIPISFSVIVSDTPIGEVEVARSLDGGSDTLPSVAAEAVLVDLHTTKRTTTIVTEGGVYENVILTGFTKNKGPGLTGGLFADLVFEQLRIIETQRIVGAAPRVTSNVGKGKQPATNSKFVNRKVNCNIGSQGHSDIGAGHGCEWFDPDVGAWRFGASKDLDDGHWRFFKGPLSADGFNGTDDEVRKHIHDSPQFGFTTVTIPAKTLGNPSTRTNLLQNPGQEIIFDDKFYDQITAAKSPTASPDTVPEVPESLRP